VKTFTLKEYDKYMQNITGHAGVLLKQKLNYSPIHFHYRHRCDCLRDINYKDTRAYEDCNDCLGKGVPAIPIGELK